MSFVLRMAVREIRASWQRLLFFFICIAVGVASIVAIRSVIQSVREGLTREARAMTGADVVKQRDMYQQLFKTMIVYLNSGFGPEDAVIKNPLKAYEAQYGDSATFTYGALRSMMIAYVPD